MTIENRKLNKGSPIHAAVPNIATLGTSATVLRMYRVLDLANAFFSIPLAVETQN